MKAHQWLLIGGPKDWNKKVVKMSDTTDRCKVIDRHGVPHFYYGDTFSVPSLGGGRATFIVGLWECMRLNERPSYIRMLELIAVSGVKPASGISPFAKI